MTLLFVQPSDLMSLEKLSREVLCEVYEPEKKTYYERRAMHDAIVRWHKKIEAKRWRVEFVGGKLEDQEEWLTLASFAKMLRDNERGDFDDRKKLFKDKKIDWRKFHRLPEAYTAEDFHKGKQIGRESDKREGVA